MPPIGPPPYTHEQISAMTSQVERTRAYAELASYVARLKREKAERQNAVTQRDAGTHHSSPTHYHPYQRPQTMRKSATDSRDANDAESFAKQLSNNGVSNKFTMGVQKELIPEAKKAPLKQLSNNAVPNGNGHQTAPKNLCPMFTAAGRCSRNVCPKIHDPNQQAVCKRWFYKDACQLGKFCFLSHVATPHNTPTCTYYMAGRCSNNDCRFAHVRVDPAALNCKSFGRMGYCEKGDTCTELHAHECPYYANEGVCHHGDNCRMGHYHRASRMKASRFPSPASPPTLHTLKHSNNPENDTNVAGADLEQNMLETDAHQQAHQFTQQADFVSFDDGP